MPGELGTAPKTVELSEEIAQAVEAHDAVLHDQIETAIIHGSPSLRDEQLLELDTCRYEVQAHPLCC